jgi:hypothetical protein
MPRVEVRTTFTVVYRGHDTRSHEGPLAGVPASIRAALICPS